MVSCLVLKKRPYSAAWMIPRILFGQVTKPNDISFGEMTEVTETSKMTRRGMILGLTCSRSVGSHGATDIFPKSGSSRAPGHLVSVAVPSREGHPEQAVVLRSDVPA